MENNNSYEKFLASYKQRLNDQQVLVECSVNMDSESPISKVLAVDSSACVDQVENLSGEASVTGTVTVDVVYITESQQIGASTYSTSFVSKVQDTSITPDAKVFVSANVEDTTVNSLSGFTAKVLCNITLCSECNKNQEVSYLSGATEDICIKQAETTCMYLSSAVSSTWTENQQCVVKEPIRKLLASHCDVVCKKWEASYNTVTVEGQIFNKLIYLTDEETPNLKTVNNTYDFRQEIASENISKDAMAEIDVCVVASQLKTTLDEKNEQTTIELEIPLRANVRVYENKTDLTIVDLYSTKNNVLLTNSGYNNCVVYVPEVFEKKIEGSVSLTENEPLIDKLLAVSYSHAKVTSYYIADDEIVVEGIACANLIYLNDEESKINSVDIEIPFVVSNSTELPEGSEIRVVATLSDVDVMVKKGRDVYLDACLKVYASVTQCVSGVVISDVQVGEPLQKQDEGIEIYFAKSGDDVWDIAKELKVDPLLIETQNSDVVFPLEKDENIAVYYN